MLVTILPDGEEYASKEYSGLAIKKMIDELKSKRWTFTYIGTEHELESFAASISNTNTVNFSKNPGDIHKWVVRESNARAG